MVYDFYLTTLVVSPIYNARVNTNIVSNHTNQNPNSYIPAILSANVRAIASKVDEIQQIAELNSAGIICITETWLSANIPDSNVSIPGYNLFRQDRVHTTGGGVCVYIDDKIPCKLINSCVEDNVESIWLSIRPYRLPRQITSIILSVIYHPPNSQRNENIILKHHVQKNLDAIFSDQPNALIIITGDFNPNSTGLQPKEIAQPNHLKQLVKFKTRDSGILDWIFVNKSKMFDLTRLPKIGTSDHYSILAKPKPKSEIKPVIKKIKIRDTRDSAWRALGRWIVEKEWSSILNAPSCEDKYDSFMCEINCAIDTFLPLQTIKKHPTDRPWITKKIKNCIYKRQSAFTRHGKDSISFKFWRNKVQREIKMAKHHYYSNRVSKLESTSSTKWWREIKRLSGQDIKHEWYHQFLEEHMDIKSLANSINDIFADLTNDFEPLTPGGPAPYVPEDLLVTQHEVYRALSSINTTKAVGPDNIPNKLLKHFAVELAPVIQDIYNQSLKDGNIPLPLKSSIVIPIPKVNPPKKMDSDLRPISLTCTLAKIMEGFTITKLLPELDNKIDVRQYARKGHSTTDALLYLLQAIFEAMDRGNTAARIFFADFSKGFDLIDHNILLRELEKLSVSPVLIRWIAAFLTNRQQAVKIGDTTSEWRTVKGGIPQGTKLGVTLFAVMTNGLIADWPLRIKFVDDTSALEILPRNSISLLNYVVTDIYEFASSHNMKLNPGKCKEMFINFMHDHNILVNPMMIGNKQIECVSNYKLLGVYLNEDLSWNTHIDYISKKACKRLYSLRILRRAGVASSSILKVYLTIIRPVLEYAVPVWQSISSTLSDKLETIQKRALKIIFPSTETYLEALQLAGIDDLANRRTILCKKYMTKMKGTNHPLHPLLPKSEDKNCIYELRDKTEEVSLYQDFKFCRTKKTENFFTFKYY